MARNGAARDGRPITGLCGVSIPMPGSYSVNPHPEIRPEVVSLLVNGQGVYADLLTPPPTKAECQAALNYLELVRDHNNEVGAELQRAVDLMLPYIERINQASGPEELAEAVLAFHREIGDEVTAFQEYLGLMLGGEGDAPPAA